jgi:hypothetical protein
MESKELRDAKLILRAALYRMRLQMRKDDIRLANRLAYLLARLFGRKINPSYSGGNVLYVWLGNCYFRSRGQCFFMPYGEREKL